MGISGFNVKVCGYFIVMQYTVISRKLILEGETSRVNLMVS